MSYEQVNDARSTNFSFIVTGHNELALRVQNPSICSINLGMAIFPTRYVDINTPGNKLDFTPMVLTFLVSEELKEWIDVYKWMVETANHSGFETQQTGELTITDSSNKPTLRIIYKGVYPLTLSPIQYSLVEDDRAITADVTLQFDSFDVEIVKTGEVIRYGENR